MVVIVGLGNPGSEYASTRHNVGWLVLDQLATELGAPEFTFQKKFHGEVTKIGQYFLLKPQTFMNDSGVAVRALLDFYNVLPTGQDGELPHLIVVHDDLDVEFGHFKLQLGTGPKIHNGLLSIYQHLHSQKFWHARVGVDARQGDRSMPGRAYVLQKFTQPELTTLQAVGDGLIQEIQSKLKNTV